MRENKFRAWCKLDKILYDWEQVKTEFTFEYLDDRGLVFQQYTGLKDENSIEIYEGDIVEIGWSDKVGEAHHWKTTIKNPFNYSTEEALNLIHAEYIEIIGNIYENPELLETKKSS